MYNNQISVVILAAGKGVRMYSALPKVLHTIAGKPLIQHVIDAVKGINARVINLVYGYGGDQLKAILRNESLNWVLQTEQFGTGHAMQQAIPFFADNEDILMIYGDIPLITVNTLMRLCSAKPADGISLLTVKLDNPNGYGRVVRKNGLVTCVVEQKDATPQQLTIKEINTGILVANSTDLKCWLSQLNNNNVQDEYYITDIIALAYADGRFIETIQPTCISEVQGVNNRLQLATLERIYQTEQAKKLLLSGLMLRDPARFDLRGKLQHGRDVEIDSNVILEGQVNLGNNVKIGTGCIIKNSIIGDGCEIFPYSVIDNTELNNFCTVGPFANLRHGNKLGEATHIGNFVEMKKAIVGKGSKVGHLSYLGDVEVGSKVNIGAGTITCNYDGMNKLKTIIGDDVFVGADTQLVAPVTIASGATIAAGTTIMKNITASELVYNRKEQIQKSGWQRRTKKNQKMNSK